jgi:hypothetical protein
MKLAAWIMVALVALVAGLGACACKGSSSGGTGPGTGNGTGSGLDAAACDGEEAHVRELYQAAAARTDLRDDEVADNVAMVMKECRAAPAKLVPCLARATAVAQLEGSCLPALDDDGREGQVFLGK